MSFSLEVVWLVSLGGLALSFMFMSLSARMDGRWYLSRKHLERSGRCWSSVIS